MQKIAFIILVCFSLLLPGISFAFGYEGHEIVASLAYQQLDKKTQDQIRKYIGKQSMGWAGNWMDGLKDSPKYNYMKQWHFINIEKGQDYKPDTAHNIVNELNRVIDELHHRESLTAEQIRIDLLVLFHLVGDLHQPLHAGYKSDLGGNLVMVKFPGKDEPVSLHAVWDGSIIRNKKITMANCRAELDGLSAAKIKKIKSGEIKDWMLESRSYLDDIYDFSDKKITQAYINKNAPVVQTQMVKGGIRLAAVLQDIFK